ncbi:MAG: NuoI/complex I 23 kDa subunit family protein [Dehalococcoidia bacterium]
MKGLLKGLGVTLSTFSRKPVTVEYPDERRTLPPRQRSFPVLLWDFDHEEPVCTGCNVCIRNCPVDCMTATMQDNSKYTDGTSNRRKIVQKFWIDYARCMRCNICVEVCPFEAIVMDNNWSGHEQAVYDRRDLHKDIDDLLAPSKSGALEVPWRPQDSLEQLERAAKGEDLAETPFKVSLPDARQARDRRVAEGLPAAIQEREPEKPKVAAAAKAGAAAASGAEAEVLSESKIKARRMRAERTAKEHHDRGEAVPAEVLADIEKYTNMKPGVPYVPGGGAAAATSGGGTGIVLTGTNPDGSMRFPPGVGDGPKGDANSPEKMKARRMRAERQFKELTDKGEAIPDEMAKTLYDLGSDLAPGGTIWVALAGAGGGSGAGAAGGEVLTGTNPDGSMRFPPGLGDGPKGDANSYEKVRARRMRAERQFKELTDKGEPIPEETTKLLYDLGSDLAPGGTIWASLAGAGGATNARASAAGTTSFVGADGKWAPPASMVGEKGTATSFEKLRARRMRAERSAREALEASQSVPDDIMATLRELGSPMAQGG